jgi:hypothetical protein
VRFGLAGAVKDGDLLGLSLCSLLESGIYLAAGLFSDCDRLRRNHRTSV